MFGLETLDVAIGMIFVFLLLSLICTAVNEIIEAWLNKRAKLLERGIQELLSKPGEENAGLVSKIYEHPLISGLFRGKYTKEGKFLPAYIPAENFAAALMDVFLDASNSSGAKAPLSTDSLRAAIEANKTNGEFETAAKALQALMETAGDDVNKVKKNVETWFNSSMDRVSGWYKRRTQVFTLLLGLGVAIGVNADAITISNGLSHDKALRDSLVTAAQEYSKNDAASTASSAASPSPATPASGEFIEECKKNKNNQGLCNESCLKNVNSAECKLQVQMANIKKLGLPIGWDKNNSSLFPPEIAANDPNRLLKIVGGWLFKIFGWLITAFAISLGAPFWFDLLNKFMVVRSTVKPKEKSPDEPAKPGK